MQAKDVKGAFVLASGNLTQAWNMPRCGREGRQASSPPRSRPTRSRRKRPDVLQWGSIPYVEALRAFGFKATPRVATRLRAELAKGDVSLHVDIETVFHRRPNRTLVAGDSRVGPGTVAGTNSASSLPRMCRNQARTTMPAAAARCSPPPSRFRTASAAAPLPPPARTITFLWVDEIAGSRQWIKDHPDQLKGVVAMLSLDMTGQDTSKTGGTFLIEKEPDPSALWPRPSDPHSEWGAGKVDPALVRGSFLNDLHLAVALRRARDTQWVVRTNPYEGGSDHTVFTTAGVPALLNWHFTDRYYHTNLDTIDKVSAAEMQHVAIVVGTTALFLASADKTDTAALTRLMETAREARLATEERNQASPEILQAWDKWYEEALASLSRLQN